MKQLKKYYQDLDIIRIVACVAVLFYHLNLLKGGYLAVGTFFVLSGYLSCMSLLKEKKVSLRKYYTNRIIKLYLPLLIVVFLTILTISLTPSINWLNLKPESTSVLLGYNNFWQLSVNLDYFAHHVNSPFMHFWYIAILLQFDLIFPLLFLLLRKLGDKVSKKIPCILTFLFAISSTIYFFYLYYQQGIMASYYHTFARLYSLFFGVFVGFLHSYYKSYVPKNLRTKKNYKKVMGIYLGMLIASFFFTDASSILSPWMMVLTTLISCRLVEYATLFSKRKQSLKDKIVKSLASLSYEIYLFQYPIIFLSQYLPISYFWKLLLVLCSILLLSFFLHLGISSSSKKTSVLFLRFCLMTCFAAITFSGAYQYVLAKDYTEELNQLENQLSTNEEIMKQKQEEYKNRDKQEEEEWLATLEDFENGEKKLKDYVRNLPIVGIGDSVMLGAVDNLYKQFPKSYFDAKVSRTAWEANSILKDLKKKNLLTGPIIFNLGSNGDCSNECKLEILKTCEGLDIFWVNVVNDAEVHVNATLSNFAKKHDNVYLIDWETPSKGHLEYFAPDRLHLTETGKKAYTTTIYNAIYQKYLKDYQKKKEEVIQQHEQEQKEKITFYGNDIFLNIYNDLEEDFPSAKLLLKKELNYKTIKEELTTLMEEDKLNYRIVLAFDNSITIQLSQYQELIELCKDHQIYIVITNKKGKEDLAKITNENVTIIPFYDVLSSSDDYVMVDKIHLTKKGNMALRNLLKETLS